MFSLKNLARKGLNQLCLDFLCVIVAYFLTGTGAMRPTKYASYVSSDLISDYFQVQREHMDTAFFCDEL